MSVYDFNGKEFDTKAEMCRHYNIPLVQFIHRMNCGWTLKEALSLSENFIVNYTDDTGNIYRTISDVCRHFCIRFNYFIRLYRKGATVDEIVKSNWEIYLFLKDTGCSSLAEYCRVNGMTTQKEYNNLYFREIRCKRNVKSEPQPANKYADLTGKMYPSLRSLCLANNYDYKNFLYLLDAGYSYDDALKKVKRIDDFIIHNGVTYKSENALCKACGISYVTYRYRRNVMGLSVEEALSPVCYRNKANK